MQHKTTNQLETELGERLATGGFRFTSQRLCVYDVLRETGDHPTAEEIFIRAKLALPEISHATVYNCLDALVVCGLARMVHLERGAARFCVNMEEHCHYYCEACGAVFDVALKADSTVIPQPKGFLVNHYEIAVHGVCASCLDQQRK